MKSQIKKREECREYVPCPGAHLSDSDANKIGGAVELLFEKLGRHPTTKEFSEAVKHKANPAHAIVSKKCEEIKQSAWEKAANYCLSSVDIIFIRDGARSAPEKAFYVLSWHSNSNVNESESLVVSQGEARNTPEIQDLLEKRFRNDLRRTVTDFASATSVERALNVAKGVVESFDRELRLTNVAEEVVA